MRLRQAVLSCSTILAALLAAGAASAAAQTVRGRVIDADTRRPLAEVPVFLVDQKGKELARSVTDSDGWFTLEAPGAGAYSVAARPVQGYEPAAYAVQLEAGAAAELPGEALALRAAASAAAEAGAEGRLPGLVRAGFYERQEAGRGDFVTLEQLDKWQPSTAIDIIRRLRKFRVQPNRDFGGGDTRQYIIQLRRAPPGIRAGADCPPLYYLDGNYLGNARDVDPNRVIVPNMVIAVEAYDGMSQPSAFNRTGATCGIIIFWTKTGG